jgi:hypothetical protein
MQQLCSMTYKDMKVYFVHLSGFTLFFLTLPNCMPVPNEIVQRTLPRLSTKQWNFKVRTVNTDV